MVGLSIGRSLVLRQLLFMGLLIVLGVVAYVASLELHDLAHSVATASDPMLARQRAGELETAAASLSYKQRIHDSVLHENALASN